MENNQGLSTASQSTLRANVDCVVDQVKFKTVWQQNNIDMKAICEMVADLSLLEDESAEIVSNLLNEIPVSISSEESLDPENYNISVFKSSTPVRKGPLLRRMDKLALNDHVSSKFSPIKPVEAEEKLDPENFEVSIFLSSTPVKRGPLLRRMDKLALNDHVSSKFSPVLSKAVITGKINSLQISVFKSSTPTQQTAGLRRFEKLGLSDFCSNHFSPIAAEPENKIDDFGLVRHQAIERCNRKLAF